MGTQYVDDHRFLLCKGSTVTDITRAVSQPEARDELDALSVELTFTAVRNNNRDKYMHWYGIEPGDKLRVVNHGREVFWHDPHRGAGRRGDRQRHGMVSD